MVAILMYNLALKRKKKLLFVLLNIVQISKQMLYTDAIP